MLSEKSQYQKVSYCIIPLKEHSGNDQINKIEHRLVVPKVWGGFDYR